MRFRLDTLSFWFGFIVASIFWWMLSALKPVFLEWREKQRQKREERRLRNLSGREGELLDVLAQQARQSHLAGNLFALDEIIIEPRLLVPPAHLPPAQDEEADKQEALLLAWEDITTSTVPYQPDWPQLGALYHTSTITPAEAISKNANLAIIGQPGSGKSTALAWLMLQAAGQDKNKPAVLEDKVAFYVHAASLPTLESEPEKTAILQPVFSAVEQWSGRRNRYNELILAIFEAGRAILLVDGLDELPPAEVDRAAQYIAQVRKTFPETRFVVAATHHYIDGLLAGDFEPLPLRPWDRHDRQAFISRWRTLWEGHVLTEAWAQTLPPHVDSVLLNAWLKEREGWHSPLEWTLFTWALYAGDLQGPAMRDAIHTHIRRLVPEKVPFEALETLGLQAIFHQSLTFTIRQTREWLKSFEETLTAESEQTAPEEENSTPETDQAEEQPASPTAEEAVVVKPSRGLVERLLESGLLEKLPDGETLRFQHPVFAAYLAGRSAASLNLAGRLVEGPDWAGKFTTLRYLAAYGNAAPAIEKLLSRPDPLFNRPLLEALRLLSEAPAQAPWRKTPLVEAARLLNQPQLPLAQRGRIATALALSQTPGMPQLFQRLLAQNDVEIVQTAILTLGLLQDKTAIPELARLLLHPSPTIYRATALALVAIGGDDAWNALGESFVGGHEDLRQAIAESLANDPKDGYETLKDAASREGPENVAFRRAAVYGLARIPQAWAQTILSEQLQYDEEWVVRTPAVTLVEARQAGSPYIPQPITHPARTPWLVAFAARQGMGISPRQDPTDILLQVLEYGEDKEKLAVLTHLRRRPNEGVIARLYQKLRGDDPVLREAVYRTLFWMASSGAQMPSLEKYGLA